MTAKRTRAGSWLVFERRFRPIIRDDGSLLRDRSELPARANIDRRQAAPAEPPSRQIPITQNTLVKCG